VAVQILHDTIEKNGYEPHNAVFTPSAAFPMAHNPVVAVTVQTETVNRRPSIGERVNQ
jgi:hypothetical protein